MQFINDAGASEAGIDAGGLFKEYWTRLAGIVFNAGYGLLSESSGRQLYPNPHASQLLGIPDQPVRARGKRNDRLLSI